MGEFCLHPPSIPAVSMSTKKAAAKKPAPKAKAGTSKPAPAKKPQAQTSSQSKSKTQEQIQLQQQDFESAVAEESGVHVTHDQIQAKAQEIWHSRGCPAGQDLQIWLEAEKALQR